MASGGARARSGPAPDPQALRRDRKDDAAWLTLPAEGRKGKVPAWPLADLEPREIELWALYWRKPQAVLWAHNQQELEVALHIRRLVEVEQVGSSPSIGTLVRQQMDALLLTIPAMNAARVRIASDEVAIKRDESVAPVRASARDRLKAINGGS
jgi:hypothetical protein